MGLMPLEFTDCLTDSPYFRENLHNHERELEKTNTAIKNLIKEVKDLINAAKNLSRAQRNLSNNLLNFQFECIGGSQTDDEIVISGSLKELGKLISNIEDERDRMLSQAYDQILAPLERFRKENVGAAKDGKKKFDKHTAKFCQNQERYLNLSTKKQDTVLQEADASLEMEQRHFCQASLEYVFLLQSVQERKKFEFVEILLGFIYRWLTFYHEGYVVADDFKPYMTDLQGRVQRTRENFNTTQIEARQLMEKMLKKPLDPGTINKLYTRQGYLYLMEKKTLGTTWCKHYCTHQKRERYFSMMPYNQISGKMAQMESFKLDSCIRRMSESIDKRFCFDLIPEDRKPSDDRHISRKKYDLLALSHDKRKNDLQDNSAIQPSLVYTFQALSEEDRKLWLDAMDGKEPTYAPTAKSSTSEETVLDELGFSLVTKCIQELENRGLEEQGLYRVGGVNSKVKALLNMGLDRRKADKVNIGDSFEWESKTVTSVLKAYFRNLSEPLLTFRFYNDFIAAAKHEAKATRVNDVHVLVHKLPPQNLTLLQILMEHLSKVANKSDKNLMTINNLGVCWGPTLLRSEEETMAAIMDIKFCNIVVEILIECHQKIFKSDPVSVKPESSNIIVKNSNHTPYRGSISSGSPPGPQQPVKPPSTKTQPVTHAVVSVYNDGPKHIHPPPPPRAFIEHSPSSHSVHECGGESLSPRYENMFGNSIGSGMHFRSRPKPIYNLMSRSIDDVVDGPGRINSTSSSTESISSKSSSREREIDSTSPQAKGRIPPVHYPPGYKATEVRVRTLYACVGENDSELSFEPNQIITNVRRSQEPGWLQGTLNGRTGLVPENYVQMLP